MKKLAYTLFFFIFLSLFNTLCAQTLSVKSLPGNARKALKDFVLIEEGSYTIGIFNGSDSLQCPLAQQVSIKSFYLNRFEVSVGDYQAFLRETGDISNHYDSTVWTKDYPYSYNEPMGRNYFWHPNFFQYPIVGISWEQAVRYCAWKTEQINQWLEKTPYRVTVRLPSAIEWEYAAVGLSSTEDSKSEKSPITKHRIYPWDGLFLQQEKKDGHFFTNCNSGPIRTPEEVTVIELPSDGFLYTAPVKSFQPNDAGLYQMAGNVSEWTSDNYATIRDPHQSFMDKFEDGEKINPAFLRRINALVPAERFSDYKIIKGGSWVDGPFYMQAGVAKIQAPNKATCTTGFRSALVIEKK